MYLQLKLKKSEVIRIDNSQEKWNPDREMQGHLNKFLLLANVNH